MKKSEDVALKEKVSKELSKIEKKYDVQILYAAESGSRAWGFESQDSDYDVRFIYKHKLDWYLSIENGRDVIEESCPGGLDISGWELRKALNLFAKTNRAIYEWLNSPMVYSEDGKFTKKLRSLIPEYYSHSLSVKQYVGMARGNFREYLKKDKVRIKKYFYVLRPILACMWIEKYNTNPPMEFEKLLNAQILDKDLRDIIDSLLVRKKAGEEMDIEDRIEPLNNFLEEKLDYYTNYPKESRQHAIDNRPLNKLFRSTLS